ncbi:hypothetical protein COTS27_00973 [Spirochaetota bacterium]|nr:hypothetical protein COTS27_00973 [Spirochaetota bacterium]
MQKFEAPFKELRHQIDLIDNIIIEKLLMRMLLSWQIGNLKKQYDQSIFQIDREREVINRMIKLKNQTLTTLTSDIPDHYKTLLKHLPKLPESTPKDLAVILPDKVIRLVYNEIMSASRAAQQPLRIGYLGAPGSFSYIAALQLFGSSSEYIPYTNFHRIFKAIDQKSENIALVPIENSTEGTVGATVDLMVSYDVEIIMECLMPINLTLLSKSKELNMIKTLVSHAQPLSQAQQWIHEHLPDVTIKEARSTVHAAEIALKNQTFACITSRQLASYYPELHILRSNLEDNHHNMTRFLVIKNSHSKTPNLSYRYDPPEKTDHNWISTLIFATNHQSGSLYKILKLFKNHNLNMTNLVSRPSKKKPFEYLFYVDFIGHHQAAHIQKALNSIKKHSQFFKFLGSYPRGKHSAKSTPPTSPYP